MLNMFIMIPIFVVKIFTNLCNRLGFLQMKRFVFVQANLRMVEGMPIGKSLKELNLDTVDITKVFTLNYIYCKRHNGNIYQETLQNFLQPFTTCWTFGY